MMDFNLDFIQNALQTNNISADGEMCLADIFEPQFTISDIGITHRWITHWDDYGLVNSHREHTGWRRFSFVDYIWLKVIVELRTFNVPLETIKKLKDKLFEINHAQRSFLVDMLDNDKFPLPEGYGKEVFIENIDIILKTQTYFNYVVVTSIKYRKPFCLLVTLDGDFDFFDLSTLEATALSTQDMMQLIERKNFISINIQPILEQFYSNERIKAAAFETIVMLSNKEKEILSHIRNGEFQEIRIKETKSKEYVVTIKKEVPARDIEVKVRGLLARGSYDEISLKRQNGHIVSCFKIEKVKV